MAGIDDFDTYLKGLELRRDLIPSFSDYPFSLPAIQGLKSLSIHSKVTFLVGENGTGKSTLLEAIAVAYGFNPEGGTKNFNFATRETHSELDRYIRLIKGIKRPKDGFFLRAESFYNVATAIDDLDGDGGPPLINSYGGVSLHKQSHGESFFAVFLNRFGGKGVYILDEPEAALSPMRQMAMLVRMDELVKRESQFIIATHSPILMAYPDAEIWLIEADGLKRVKYEETEHYQVMRSFINNPGKMLKILLK
jgi:predicted ATPase